MATDNNHPVWEYRVIHLNVSPPAGPSQAKSARSVSDGPPPPSVKPPPKPTPSPSAEPQKSGSPNPIFSQAYLEQEFPSFYSHPPSSRQGGGGGGGGGQSSHPAHQLQNFLNTNGENGWELVGFYPVGPLMLMIFRRQKFVEVEQSTTVSSETSSTASSPDLVSRILERLEQLESAVGAGSGAKSASTDSQGPSQPRILSTEELRPLEKLPHLTTLQAAEAIGYRSVDTLQRFLRRYGSKPGLVKANNSGVAVVYLGRLVDPESGREQGMWCLLPDSVS